MPPTLSATGVLSATAGADAAPVGALATSRTLHSLRAASRGQSGEEVAQAVRMMSVHGKYAPEVKHAVSAWRWLQCYDDGAAPTYLTRASPPGSRRREMLLVVGAGNLSLLRLPADRLVLLNRSLPLSSAHMRAGCPWAFDVEHKGGRHGMLSTVAVGTCTPSLTLSSALAMMVGGMRGCEAGGEEQHSLQTCVHACSACPLCAAISFSHDQARRGLHACTLHHEPCNGSRLLPPTASSGWDVVTLGLQQARGVLEGRGYSQHMAVLPPPRHGHCGPTEHGVCAPHPNAPRSSVSIKQPHPYRLPSCTRLPGGGPPGGCHSQGVPLSLCSPPPLSCSPFPSPSP